jgi:hypothetical protein
MRRLAQPGNSFWRHTRRAMYRPFCPGGYVDAGADADEDEPDDGAVLVDVPGDVDVDVPGDVDVDVPGDVDVEVPGDVEVDVPGDVDVDVPGDVEVEVPGDVDVYPLGEEGAVAGRDETPYSGVVAEEDMLWEGDGDGDTPVGSPDVDTGGAGGVEAGCD